MIKISLESFSTLFFCMCRHGLAPLELLLYIEQDIMSNGIKTIDNILRAFYSKNTFFYSHAYFIQNKIKSKQPILFTQDALAQT